ncbi:MAG: hypothetical protein CR997_07920 [Acidobacteria bacterium]|nr:MAG: hypothetical protein CR997_07920 [Acidobacteriota bacterium]
MQLAAKKGDLELVTTLFENGVDIDAKNPNTGYTPVLLATLRGHRECVQKLLELGADINVQDSRGNSLLHISISRNNEEITRLLLDKKIDIGLKDDRGNAPIHKAILVGNRRISKMLLAYPSTLNQRGNLERTPLILATVQQRAYLINLLLNKGADIDAKDEMGNTAWDYADHIALIQPFLAKGTDINQATSTYPSKLFFAVDQQDKDLLEFLLANGAKVNQKDPYGWTPLMLARVLGYEQFETLAKQNLPEGVQLEAPGENLAYFAAIGDLAKVKSLLASGQNIDSLARSGATPLLMAAAYEKMDVCEYLLEKGAFIDVQNDEGWTPLMFAATTSNLELLQLLLELGADYNLRTKQGVSLYYLAKKHHASEDVFRLFSRWNIRPLRVPCCN